MNQLSFYVRYALRSLLRDNTTLLAGLSITFGVLSLVSMQLLANTLLHGSMFDQRMQYGGDARIETNGRSSSFTPDELAQIATWQQEGIIADYTLIANGSASLLRTADNGRVTFLTSAIGIDVTSYPLLGNLELREPAGSTPADVLKLPTDALITRDIAEERHLRVGDAFRLSNDNTPFELTVAGIIGATPNQQGSTVFYSLETAQLIENRPDVINAIALNWGTVPNASQIVIDSPFMVYVAVDRAGVTEDSSSIALFDIMLKGAGVLGLLVGGISVSNTLRVILARRKLEIAMLKTLGYRQSDLLILISLETGLIGLIGGSIGAWLGSQIAGKLLDLLASTGSLMLQWQPDPVIVAGGVIAGVLTAVVFGMQAILVSSATRPVQLLRDLPYKISLQTRALHSGLYLLMLLILGVLVGFVLGSPLEGIAYIFVGGIIVVLLRALFWVVLWLSLLIPLPAFPMLRLARASLRQRKMQASLAVMALFAGAFSVTFAALIINNAQTRMASARDTDEGYNLLVYTTPAGKEAALNAVQAQGAQSTYITERIRGEVNGMSILIEGRAVADLNTDMQYGGTWADGDAVALLPDEYSTSYTQGDTLTLSINGQTQTVTLAGFYHPMWNSLTPQSPPLIVPHHVMQLFTDVPLQTRVFGNFEVARLSDATTALGQSLTDTLVFSRADINDAMIRLYQSLFGFAASVAGLAFVAGAVLIANAAGLNIFERYREIGVFKAVGYTSGHVLRVLLSEYGFLGMLAGIFGVTGAVIAVLLIGEMNTAAQFVIEPPIVLGMLLFSVSIAVASAAAVAWQPTRVRPLEVLRYE